MDIRTMTATQREEAAGIALATHHSGTSEVQVPNCPFLSNFRPDSPCTKVGGVCSIREYADGDPVDVLDTQPATVCPSRFLELDNGESVFAYMAKEFFDVKDGVKVINEIPFLEKLASDGSSRSAKAGRIDWVVVPKYPEKGDATLEWIAVETQAVYFSGANMWVDIEKYLTKPNVLHLPQGVRRPDYRSSGPKRLAPQLDVKSPVMIRWGRKVAVVVDATFFAEMSKLPDTVSDFDNAEVIWIVMKFTDGMELKIDQVIFAELSDSIQALQATRPVNKSEFEAGLRQHIVGDTPKVHDA